MSGDATASAAHLRFVGGNPTDEEVAVVTTVLLARAAAASARSGASEPQTASMWGRPAHVRRARPRSWVASRLPR